MKRVPALALYLSLCLVACGEDDVPAEPEEGGRGVATVEEEAVQLLPIGGALARQVAEVSGMAWHGDRLFLLPQHPRRFSECGGDGCLFTLGRQQLVEAVDGAEDDTLMPQSVTFLDGRLEAQIEGFEGYEAIAFIGDAAFVTVEVRMEEGMRGYLVRGRVEQNGSVLRLDASTMAELPDQAGLRNMSYEALVTADRRVLAMHEANGVNVNAAPVVYGFDAMVRPVDTLAFSTIEYRVTDATEPDTSGLFWVINYFYPGDQDILAPAHDSVRVRHGEGATHAKFNTIERLVPLRITPDGVRYAARPPLLLELMLDDASRNWEGIARLDDRGFLLVTDFYPETLLAFVPHDTAHVPLQ